MSTILDALRKVEENQRTRSADARARLLSFPTQPDGYSSRQRRTPWVVGAGLALAGFATGAGLMLWGPHLRTPEEGQLAQEIGLDVAQDKGLKPLVQPLVQPPVQPPPQLAVQPLAQAPVEIPPPPTPAPDEMPAPTQITSAQLTSPASPAPPAPVPAAVPPVPQTIMSKFSSPTPPLPTPTKALSGPSAPVVAATPPEIRSAPAEPFARSLDTEAEARRSALRDARRARHTHGGTPPPELQDLAKTARAARARSRLSLEARGEVLDEAPIPRGATGGANPVAKATTPASAPSAAPPDTSLSFLQWSPEPDRRLAFIKINGGPLTLAHEGDTVEGFTVVEIRRDAVELSSKGQRFTLQADQ